MFPPDADISPHVPPAFDPSLPSQLPREIKHDNTRLPDDFSYTVSERDNASSAGGSVSGFGGSPTRSEVKAAIAGTPCSSSSPPLALHKGDDLIGRRADTFCIPSVGFNQITDLRPLPRHQPRSQPTPFSLRPSLRPPPSDQTGSPNSSHGERSCRPPVSCLQPTRAGGRSRIPRGETHSLESWPVMPVRVERVLRRLVEE